MFLLVSLGSGYKYSYYVPGKDGDTWNCGTKGINIHLSSNGALRMTFKELNQMLMAVDEATAVLVKLKK